MADFVNFEAVDDIDEIDDIDDIDEIDDEQIISENVSDVDFIDDENNFDENLEDYYAFTNVSRSYEDSMQILLLILIGLRRQITIGRMIMIQPKKQLTNLRILQESR